MSTSLIAKWFNVSATLFKERSHYPLGLPSLFSVYGQKDIYTNWYSTLPPATNNFNSKSPLDLTIAHPLSKETIKIIPQLFKIKLSTLVLCTTLTGFLIVPGVNIYNLASAKILLHTLFGTALSSFSANAFNQWIEASFDAQMKRTQSRPLPSRMISLPCAFLISGLVGITGVSYLYYFVSGLSSLIAASTIVLYAGIYTPMKRYSIANTWIGSVVGALPPLIGWTAGLQSLTLSGAPLFGWVPIFGLLYFWQFPHFFSLSWALRRDYARAGYQMCSLVNPDLAVSSSLRNTLAMFPLMYLFYLTEVSNIYFVFVGSLINCILLFPAIDFKIKRDSHSARRLFFCSLIHLPMILVSLFLFKQQH